MNHCMVPALKVWFLLVYRSRRSTYPLKFSHADFNSVSKYKTFHTSTLRKALIPVSIILTGKISILLRSKSCFTFDNNFFSRCEEPAIWLVDCIWLWIDSTGGWNANKKKTFHFVCVSRKKYKLTVYLATNVWLRSSVDRALRRYRGGHWFESRWHRELCRLFIFQLLLKIRKFTEIISHYITYLYLQFTYEWSFFI